MMADASRSCGMVAVMPRLRSVMGDARVAWWPLRSIVWRDGGCALAMSHGSGCAEVMVGVRRQLHRVTVAAWHGSGGWSHGLVVVAAVMSRRLRHGCGGSGGGNSGHIAL
jgi:hypothetical protein